MSSTVVFAANDVLADVRTFLSRAHTLGCDAVRLSSRRTALAMSVGILWRESLLDTTPTILGMRVAEIRPTEGGEIDSVVGLVALRDRVARDEATVALPPPEIGVIWAGIAPPLAEWETFGAVSCDALSEVASRGIAEVAAGNGMGSKAVIELRRTVWSRIVDVTGVANDDGLTSEVALPAGAGLAAFGLGFLVPGGLMTVSVSGGWTRLTNERGHVLVRSVT